MDQSKIMTIKAQRNKMRKMLQKGINDVVKASGGEISAFEIAHAVFDSILAPIDDQAKAAGTFKTYGLAQTYLPYTKEIIDSNILQADTAQAEAEAINAGFVPDGMKVNAPGYPCPEGHAEVQFVSEYYGKKQIIKKYYPIGHLINPGTIKFVETLKVNTLGFYLDTNHKGYKVVATTLPHVQFELKYGPQKDGSWYKGTTALSFALMHGQSKSYTASDLKNAGWTWQKLNTAVKEGTLLLPEGLSISKEPYKNMKFTYTAPKSVPAKGAFTKALQEEMDKIKAGLNKEIWGSVLGTPTKAQGVLIDHPKTVTLGNGTWVVGETYTFNAIIDEKGAPSDMKGYKWVPVVSGDTYKLVNCISPAPAKAVDKVYKEGDSIVIGKGEFIIGDLYSYKSIHGAGAYLDMNLNPATFKHVKWVFDGSINMYRLVLQPKASPTVVVTETPHEILVKVPDKVEGVYYKHIKEFRLYIMDQEYKTGYFTFSLKPGEPYLIPGEKITNLGWKVNELHAVFDAVGMELAKHDIILHAYKVADKDAYSVTFNVG